MQVIYVAQLAPPACHPDGWGEEHEVEPQEAISPQEAEAGDDRKRPLTTGARRWQPLTNHCIPLACLLYRCHQEGFAELVSLP